MPINSRLSIYCGLCVISTASVHSLFIVSSYLSYYYTTSFFYAKMFAFFFFWVVILPFSSVLIFSIMRSKHLLLNISSKNSAFLACLHPFEKHFYCFFNRFPCWQRQSLYPSVWHPFHDHSLKLAHSPT